MHWLSGVQEGLRTLIGRSNTTERVIRLCVSCNKVVGETASECPHCGAQQTQSARFIKQLSADLPDVTRVSPLLIGVMVMLYVTEGLMSIGRPDFSLYRFLLTGDRETSALLGGLHGYFLQMGGQWWRLINANFLHFGAIHLFFNLSALRVLGPMVEEEYGSGWFFFTYVYTGICGFYASYWYHPEVFTVGASASLFGLIGVGIGYAYRERDRRAAQLRVLLQWAVIGIGIGFVDLIPMNNAAHIGGLAAGLGFGLLLSPREATRRGFFGRPDWCLVI